MAGTKTWATGDVLSAADLNGYVRDQWITICTSGTRPTTSQEGRTIHETDTDRYYRWDGAAWQLVKAMGAWDTWTPTITQGATPTQSVTSGLVIKEGRHVQAKCQINFATSGTASTVITFDLPYDVPAAPAVVGSFVIYDYATTLYSGFLYASAAYSCLFVVGGVYADYLGVLPAYTLGNNDQAWLELNYLSNS